MKIVTDTWRQLVQRRLWPVAVLLLGALVAVPFMLSKSPEPPAAPPAPASGAQAASADPIVAMAADEEDGSPRRVLGDRHNPFAPTGHVTKPKTAKDPTASAQTGHAPKVSPGGGSSAGEPSSGLPPTGAPPVSTPPTTSPKPPMETLPAGSLKVRFGSSDAEELPTQTLKTLEALPSADEPLLVYVGLKDGGKTAVFMLGDGVTATGDGSCHPADTCETIELRAGETEFFDVAAGDGAEAAQFELDVVTIHQHKTHVPATDTTTPATVLGPAVAARAARVAKRLR